MYGSLLPESGRYASPEIVKGSWNVIKEYLLPGTTPPQNKTPALSPNTRKERIKARDMVLTIVDLSMRLIHGISAL
jgi:hypothetical protein